MPSCPLCIKVKRVTLCGNTIVLVPPFPLPMACSDAIMLIIEPRNQERSPTSAPVNQDLRDKAMTGAAEDLDDNDTTEARDATGDPSDDDSDSTEAGEVRHRPCDNDSESDAEIRAHGPSHAIKQLLKQPLRRRKAKAATTNYRLKPHERRIRHYRSARQVAVEKHNAAVEKWTQQKAEWAKKAKNKGKPYHVPEPVLAPARKVNKNCKLLCFTPLR